MKLNLSQIKNISLGAVRIEETESGIQFYRFTKQQEALYKKRSDVLYGRTFTTSGVQIRFKTDSKRLFLEAEICSGTGRTYFSFDVFVNGEKIDTLDNFSHERVPDDYTKASFPLGVYAKEFYLGDGEKEVCIYFPWSVNAVVKELILDDDSFIKSSKPSKKMLCFGDSITQGYDALHPCNKYISQLANMLDAEEYNKAIGAEIFFPELAAAKDDFSPDYITVAYGTNDWNRCSKEEFTCNCREFFRNLRQNYPSVKILAITPIWRKEMHEAKPFGDFEGLWEIIQKQAADFDNISVIQGLDLVPPDEKLYGDSRLHPNDRGFAVYFENLAKSIKDFL